MLLAITPKINSQPTLTVTMAPDYPTYTQRDLVTIRGNVTYDGSPLADGLVGVQVDDPGKTIVMRTFKLNQTIAHNFPVAITSVLPCDDKGDYKPNAERDVDMWFSMSVRNYLYFEDEPIYFSLTIVDSAGIPLETERMSQPIPQNQVGSLLARMRIPRWATAGTGIIYANVYTAWPEDGGYPLDTEETAYFTVIESTYVIPPIIVPPQPPIQNGKFELKFILSPDMIPGQYALAATAWRAKDGSTKSAFSSFKANYTALPPRAGFAAKPPIASANYSISFDATPSSPEGYNDSIASYSWKFGDGGTATGRMPSHSYVHFGDYTVILNVTDLEGFWNTTSKVMHIAEVHEISLQSIQCPNIVYDKWTVYVTVLVANKGTMPETFNMRLYVNNSLVRTIQVNLNILETKNVTLIWDTTGIQVLKHYSLRADADTLLHESNTTDNTITSGLIWTVLLGDTDGNRIIDIFDVTTVATVYNSREGQPGWYPLADLVRDGVIDIYDIVVVTVQYDARY
jgi:PKD repeat protein